MLNETRSCEQLSTTSEGSLDVNANVILRVECISRSSLKVRPTISTSDTACTLLRFYILAAVLQKFVCVQFLLRWAALCVWLIIAALAYRKHFYRPLKLRDLHLNTAVSAFFLASVVAVLSTLIYFVVRVSRSRQQW